MGAIVGRLSDEDSRVRCLAVKTLGSLGDQLDGLAVREIVRKLPSIQFDVRAAAIEALGSLGDRLDAEATHGIVELLRAKAPWVQRAAYLALKECYTSGRPLATRRDNDR